MAFIDTVKEYDLPEYQFSIRETQTSEVIDDVKNMKSEVGVIALSEFNRNTFKKIFVDASLEFHELFSRDTYVYLSKAHAYSIFIKRTKFRNVIAIAMSLITITRKNLKSMA